MARDGGRNLMTLTTILSLSCLTVLLLGSSTESHSIVKRNIFQLCNLVSMYTNFSCWDVNDYGCFCGYGQVGRKPVDPVDECCYQHDMCYHQVRCYFSAQFVTFNMDCKNGSCKCIDPFTCSRDVCNCEVGFAECLRGKAVNDAYRTYDRTQCRY